QAGRLCNLRRFAGAGLDAADVARDLLDHEVAVAGVEGEVEGRAGVEVLGAVEVGVNDLGGDGQRGPDVGREVDAHPDQAGPVGGGRLVAPDQQADAAPTDVEQLGGEWRADLGEEDRVGSWRGGAAAAHEDGEWRLVCDLHVAHAAL